MKIKLLDGTFGCSLVLFALLATAGLVGCGVFQNFRDNVAPFQPQATQEEFDTWAASMKTPSIVGTALNMDAWAQANMTYKADGRIDYPKQAVVTFSLKNGDCDDWSSMFMEAFYRNGSTGSARLFCVFNAKEGHAVCAFQAEDGNYYHISNWGGLRGGLPTYRALAATVFADWTSYKVLDFDMAVTESGTPLAKTAH